MAKKKDSIYTTWEEINTALRKLGELKIKKEKFEGDMNIKINELKANYGELCKQPSEEIDFIEKNITLFCDKNKASFTDKRSKKMDFGTVSYRVTASCKCSNPESIISSLKSLDLDYCIRIKEEVDKDELKKLDSKTLAKIGISITTKDKLAIEPNTIRIAASL